MSFSSVFKKSFLNMIDTGDISVKSLILTMGIACIFAAYIFIAYRVISRKTFYNKNFNMALAAITVIVTAIVITIQSSLVVSLGMVGVLSIVRFRTAIKDPMDLVFLFWSIANGIICGAGLPGIAGVSSIVITLGILLMDMIPVAKAPMLLVINCGERGISARAEILQTIAEHTGSYCVKSQTVTANKMDLIVEVRVKDQAALLEALNHVDAIVRYSMISHDGEVTF